MVINHLLNGMILQVRKERGSASQYLLGWGEVTGTFGVKNL